MPDWKNPDWKKKDEYTFKDANRRERWVWEFLRRNTAYRAAYKTVSASAKKQGLTTPLPPSKMFQRLSSSPTVQGALWRIKGPIHDPDSDTVPDFRPVLPQMPSPDEVLAYFGPITEEQTGQVLPQFTVLAFQLDAPLKAQLLGAEKLLKSQQKRWLNALPKGQRKSMLVRRSLAPQVFPTYLRVLDAKAEKASTDDILKHIEAYASVRHKTGPDWDYQALNRIGRDKVKADILVTNPWSLLAG